MTSTSFEEFVANTLSEAYGDNAVCPAPERFVAAANGELNAAENEALARHAAECPACAAERTLAAAYVNSPAEIADADAVASLVKELQEKRGSTGNVVKFPNRWRQAVAPLAGLAAAAAITLAIFPPLFVSSPGLPERSETSIMRSSSIQIQQPAGELAATPGVFAWDAVGEARSYRLRVMTVDNDILWESNTEDTRLRTSNDLAEKLVPAVRYTWQVEALDNDGTSIAWSEPMEIRISPRR